MPEKTETVSTACSRVKGTLGASQEEQTTQGRVVGEWGRCEPG